MPSDSYILLCAGEDSGDCIGESLLKSVCEAAEFTDSFKFIGAGGLRMQNAGLKPIVNYETLPVSGFGDILPKYLKLYRAYQKLEQALRSPSCLGLIAIDYPGFNMKLVRLASKLHKPSLYVAPPQVWAWKAKRAKQLASLSNLKLAVFFDFERLPYEKAGCNVTLTQHPFLHAVDGIGFRNHDNCKNKILLFPGSRESQMRRNLPEFLELSNATLKSETEPSKFALFSRENLLEGAKKRYSVADCKFALAPQQMQDRATLFSSAKFAIVTPGTATLELALCGCPAVVMTRPDFLTYHLGKHLVKTKYFSLPSLILGEQVYPEYILHGKISEDIRRQIQESVQNSLSTESLQKKKAQALRLRQKLSEGCSIRQLMLEFLAQFVKRQPH